MALRAASDQAMYASTHDEAEIEVTHGPLEAPQHGRITPITGDVDLGAEYPAILFVQHMRAN